VRGQASRGGHGGQQGAAMASVRSKWTRAARMGRAFQAAIMPHLKNEGLRFGVAVDGSQVRAWLVPSPRSDASPRHLLRTHFSLRGPALPLLPTPHPGGETQLVAASPSVPLATGPFPSSRRALRRCPRLVWDQRGFPRFRWADGGDLICNHTPRFPKRPST